MNVSLAVVGIAALIFVMGAVADQPVEDSEEEGQSVIVVDPSVCEILMHTENEDGTSWSIVMDGTGQSYMVFYDTDLSYEMHEFEGLNR